ncbi:kelch-like protein 5 [Lampris incognitus]|uniref:kelch-like protein 5 n=1 Tax=Lampris incognitus TaxID=2546036 RepID=UPI0024B55115|nr:kelch-like protein 5 [Lampris incognitus]
MSSGGSSSSSRKEFDVKQILRIRWRWFGHPAVPPPHSPPPADYFTGSGAGDSPGDGPAPASGSGDGHAGAVNSGAGGRGGLALSGSAGSNLCDVSHHGRKLGDSAGSRRAPAATASTASSCPRSFSQPECRSAAALSWVSPPCHPHSRPRANMEPPAEVSVPEPCSPPGSEGEGEAGAGSNEENNNRADTDSSSCRTSNSSATLSSCVSMEPCVCPEECVFTAMSHADVTFRKMEGYLRARQLCDITLVVGDRRIPAHRYTVI